MKKILFSLCTLAMMLVSACNLDLRPTSSISTDEALRSMDDAQKLRRDLYITMRNSLTSGAPVYLMELMADSFHGSITYGNRNGEYYKWEKAHSPRITSYCAFSAAVASSCRAGIPSSRKLASITR